MNCCYLPLTVFKRFVLIQSNFTVKIIIGYNRPVNFLITVGGLSFSANSSVDMYTFGCCDNCLCEKR